MKDLGDIICIDNFFTDEELQLCEERALSVKLTQARPSYGVFPNQLIADYKSLDSDQDVIKMYTDRLNKLFDCYPGQLNVSCCTLVTLYLPWDIHSDLHLDMIPLGFHYGYNFLIPLKDVESRTIIFNQWSETTVNFYEYKDTNDKVEFPIDKEFWDENLSMCWPHDREYLTLKQVLPYQRRGQLLGFNRKFFHSSDNFHTRSIKEKSFIQLRIDFAI